MPRRALCAAVPHCLSRVPREDLFQVLQKVCHMAIGPFQTLNDALGEKVGTER